MLRADGWVVVVDAAVGVEAEDGYGEIGSVVDAGEVGCDDQLPFAANVEADTPCRFAVGWNLELDRHSQAVDAAP